MQKAVVEYSRGNFLNGIAQNVLAISINTGENPRIIVGNEVNYKNMLAWGPIREHRFTFDDCRGSLLFIDGFDEFIDEAKKADVKDIVLFMDTVGRIAKKYSMHIVILSRSIAVQEYLSDPEIRYKSFTLSPITNEQQVDWLKERNNYSDYSETLMKLQADKDMSVLLGIPLLFRMIVHTKYNKVNSNIVELYDGLFEHLMRKRRIRGAVLEKIKQDLSDHAYKVYCNDEDTAEVELVKKDENWVVAFYVKTGQGGNIGFFHRSFYQYFLARYILFRILDIVTDEQAEKLIGLFAERELDKTVRQYLSFLINEKNKQEIYNKLKLVIEALIRTEAYLNLEPRYHDGNAERTKLGRTINVYRNTLHVLAAFSYVIENRFRDGIDVLLSTYPSNAIKICSTENKRADLSSANLIGAYLLEADLSGADLSSAYLSGAILIEADLSGANLSGAKLNSAELAHADLRGACLNEANLRGAILNKADLRGANLNRADLSEADLSGIDLSGVNLRRVNLSRANLSGAILSEAIYSGAFMSEVNLIQADLSGADLSGANLNDADLRRADLSGANLRGAILNRADLSRTSLREANLSRADLRGANLNEADLSEAIVLGVHLDEPI